LPENVVLFSLRNDEANAFYLVFDIVFFWLIQSHPQTGPSSATSGNKNPYRFGWLIYQMLCEFNSSALRNFEIVHFFTFLPKSVFILKGSEPTERKKILLFEPFSIPTSEFESLKQILKCQILKCRTTEKVNTESIRSAAENTVMTNT